jgi:N-acetylglucosaminyltransferase
VPTAAGFLDLVLPSVFTLYLVTVGVYLGLQVSFAEGTRRRHAPVADDAPMPSVDIVVACFNEKPATLAACLESLVQQDYQGPMTVYVVDDGSPNRSALMPVYETYGQRPAFWVLLPPENQGKRYAQAQAIQASHGDIIIAVDSDTVIAPDGVREMVGALAAPDVGAVMGEMLALNKRANWLTRLIDVRYWYACNQERAAQSRFGAVLCCSGPFAAYRRTVFEKVLDAYLNQTFMGRRSTYGEDRYLTNLILRCGSRTVYAPNAKALTAVPERIRPFLRQQLRWNRSMYRDTVGIARHLPSFGAYLVLDGFVQVFAPVLLGLSVVLLLLHAALVGVAGSPWYLGGLLLVSAGYCGYGVWRNRDLGFARFALYGLLHIALLIPSRIWALLSITDDRWGRRGASA